MEQLINITKKEAMEIHKLLAAFPKTKELHPLNEYLDLKFGVLKTKPSVEKVEKLLTEIKLELQDIKSILEPMNSEIKIDVSIPNLQFRSEYYKRNQVFEPQIN